MYLPIFILAIIMAPFCCAQNQSITIPAKTPLFLEFTSEVSSKTAIIGAPVQFALAEDLVADEKIIIPKGALAFGEVIHAQKSGLGGRGGELIIAVRNLEFKNMQIKLRSFKPIAQAFTGKNNSNAVLATGIIVGVFSMFITGGEIVIPVGTRASALVAEDTSIDVAVNGKFTN